MSELKKFIELSRVIGKKPDFVQGTGGNVSIKINKQKMLIKASGWRLADISENQGLVAVDYNRIKNNGNFIFDSQKTLRPSMETRFHAFLGKHVVHTHAVYANIISCAVEGKKLWRKITEKHGISASWVDYQNPGTHLALGVKKAVKKFKNQYGKIPEAILMQNHGLIVSGDNLNYVFNLHNKIQEVIKNYFNLKIKFPEIKSDYLKKIIKKSNNLIVNFSKDILFPDQAVFGSNIGKKISINKKTSNIIYKVSQKEALAIKENLIAWTYIVDCAKDCGLTLNFISQKNIDYINNMESEKYRKNLIKKN